MGWTQKTVITAALSGATVMLEVINKKLNSAFIPEFIRVTWLRLTVPVMRSCRTNREENKQTGKRAPERNESPQQPRMNRRYLRSTRGDI